MATRSSEDRLTLIRPVKQMVPAVDDITIRTPSNRKIGLQLAGSHFGGLVSRLYELASRASYFSTARYLPMDLQPDSMRNLVHLEYLVKSGNSSEIMQVVRQNSQTLQHLALSSQKDLHISGLIIHDDSGSYTEYPRLTTLDLNLQTSRDICDILRTFDVFTPTSHPRLQCIKIEQFPEEMTSHFESSRAYLQFVLSIAPGASVRDIAGVTDTDWLPPALSLLHTCIQVLALPDTRLLLCDVISLIDSLPLLSDLYCLETGLGVLAEDSALDTFSARMRSRRHPTAERFRCWHLGYRDVSNLKDAVMCVLGVALICPNFSHVALSISVHSEFMALMEETIELESLQQYSQRLRRLLFRN
ncbi:hypothetical protein GGF44_003214 [Coemansia sp. RSA 1694]|nr:hypothetical protein GGF44_003214 [Coemansia sp. RSA 1694]